ncbi:MAG: 4-hydroxy-tetrahydrodipicolinate synthase [Pseudomonadota bacterium]
MFKGSITALITPFKDGVVDEAAYERFVDWQIREGTHGLVPVGTTGESPTLSHEEHRRVVDLCIKVADGRVPVIAGAGSNATSEAIELADHAKAAGAAAALVVMPYYNKPTQEGLYLHIKAIHDAVDIPIILYNVPARTISDMQPDTMARCAALERVVGVKDATANVGRLSQERLRIGDGFCYLSGEDPTALGFNAHGGHGCISVTSNVAPALSAAFQNACAVGDFTQARALHEQLMPLHDALFCETSPGPVKYAAWRLGLCEADARLPLAPVTDAAKATVDAALAKVGLTQQAVAAE